MTAIPPINEDESSILTHEVKPQVELMDPREYDYVISLCRQFFRDKKGFIETPVQHRLSILAACEDPSTVAPFMYAAHVWPLPQTGQMHLEYELLRNQKAKGFYCISTSYRNEPDPIPGRHDRIFQMFEFECPGDMESLQELECEFLEFLGFGLKNSFPILEYMDIAHTYGVQELKAPHEELIYRDFGSVGLLRHFPFFTSPFWNMKRWGDVAKKIDVIICGMEALGSAERSTDTDEMWEAFFTISDGMYAKILFAHFGKDRVVAELKFFLSLVFFPRIGGGIGLNRLIRGMKKCGLMPVFPSLN